MPVRRLGRKSGALALSRAALAVAGWAVGPVALAQEPTAPAGSQPVAALPAEVFDRFGMTPPAGPSGLSGALPDVLEALQPVPVAPPPVPRGPTAPQTPGGLALPPLAGRGPGTQGPAIGLPTGSGGLAILVPNMLGDQTGGACGGLRFGGLLRVSIDHPTFGCSRLNISESNSPVPRDRVYFRYNHFADQSLTDIFSDTPRGSRSEIDIDRFTFGYEQTFLDGRVSTEFRLPVNYQLTSNLMFTDVQGRTNLPLDTRDTSIGNLGWINKFLVYRSDVFNVSTGFGVNIPTAPAVRISADINNDNFVLDDPGPAFPAGRTAPVRANFAGVVRNETVNLSPFLAALFTPTERAFAHGFWQTDVPLNKSKSDVSGRTSVTVPGLGTFTAVTPLEEDLLKQQTLMRFNFGAGYWVYRNPGDGWITGLAPTVECHYTTTIDNARLLNLPLQFFPGSAADLTVGNLMNRRDVVNMTFGATASLGDRGLAAFGYVVPLSTQSNKPFDYELTVQLTWLFGGGSRRGY